MDLRQSHFQNLLDRLYTHGLFFLLTNIAVFVLLKSQVSDEYQWTSLWAVLGAYFVIPVWLFLFNSGRSKIDAFAIKLDEVSIVISHYGENTGIKKECFKGYNVTDSHPKKIIIEGGINEQLSFSYYALNKWQRAKLFTALDTVNR